MDEKKEVWVELRHFGHYELEGPLEELPKKITDLIYEIRAYYSEKYTKFRIHEVSKEYGEERELIIQGCRLEDDKEYEKRIKDEADCENFRRQQYENLKKIYEPQK